MLLRGTVHALAILTATSLALGCSSSRDGDQDGDENEGALTATWFTAGCRDQPTDDDRCDQGLYWLGKNDEQQQWRAGKPNRFFDRGKPTVIYVHGWQPGLDHENRRERLTYAADAAKVPADVHTVDAWIDAGWNVGFFYWDRLAADVGEGWLNAPDWAEAKIWRTDGPGGMRWKRKNDSWETHDVPDKPASEIFFDTYVAAMQSYEGNNVRLVGHSLGNQMAVRLAEKLHQAREAGAIADNLVPKRVALLDPYWTKQPRVRGVAPVSAGVRVRDAVYMLARAGVAIEQYRTSSINAFGLGDDNPFVEENTAYSEIYPGWTSWNPLVYLREDHVAAPKLYFWSLAFPAPNACGSTKDHAISAASDDKAIIAAMGGGSYWAQKDGRGTSTPGDDCFVSKNDGIPEQLPMGLAWSSVDLTQGTARVHIDEKPPNTTNVTYYVDGNRSTTLQLKTNNQDFDTTLTAIPKKNEVLVVASAFDSNGKRLGSSENMIDFGEGVGMHIRQMGTMAYEVGFERPPANLAAAELDVDGAEMIDSTTMKRRSERKEVLTTYEKNGGKERRFVLRGYDARGGLLATVERSFNIR